MNWAEYLANPPAPITYTPPASTQAWLAQLGSPDAVVPGAGFEFGGGGLSGQPTGTPVGTSGTSVAPTITAVATGLGIPGIGATLVAAYGLSQALGLQYPWETGPGEGFIAPWERDIKKDENDRWVTKHTRPDLWGLSPGQAKQADAAQGVSGWQTSALRADGSIAVTKFLRLPGGRIAVMSPSGVIKQYRPPRHIVLPRGTTTLSQAIKAQRYLDKMWRTVAKKTKQLKLA